MTENNPISRPKAFFLNGGMGRIICAIPALEKYYNESNDKDFIIVIEGIQNILDGHPTLDSKTFDYGHKNLFHTKLVKMDVISLEPYRVWEYYNQKCNITQAFDILINNKGVRELSAPTINLSQEELLAGKKAVKEIKDKLKKEKVIVLQPFGRGIQQIDNSFVDKTCRSMEFKNLKSIIRKLQAQDYAIILMAEFGIELKGEKYPDEVAMPEGIDLRKWLAIIKNCDHFLGCDSVGQHLAYIGGTEATVIIGATFPVNTSYPKTKGINIIDMGQIDREYDPIRITNDEQVSRHNEKLMWMSEEVEDYVVNVILGKQKTDEEEQNE